MSEIKKLPPTLIFGVGHFSIDPEKAAAQTEMLQVLRENGIEYLDTARHYVRISSSAFSTLANIW